LSFPSPTGTSAAQSDAAVADALRPIPIHRTLDGELLRAFEHMADALRILDLLSQTSATGALMAAIALITAEPEAWANDEMTAALFIDRYEAYRQAVDLQRTDLKWATRPTHDF